MDKLLHRVRGMVERGERISAADCRGLFDLHNLNDFSKLARIVRERRYGKDVLLRAAEVFEYKGEHPELFLSEMETVADPTTLELVVKPIWKGDDSVGAWLERFAAFGQHSRLVTVSLDTKFIACVLEVGEQSVGEFLTAVRELLPVWLSGSGAEVFDDRWRAEFAVGAVSSERWLAIHQVAHEIGMKTGAAITYHNGWNPDLYVAHLDTLRSLQDKTGGFQSFTPMGFHDTHPDARYLATPSGGTTLKVTAICRLFLDNIPHVVTAPNLGDPEISWTALSYGADAVDPTIYPSDLSYMDTTSSLTSDGELLVLADGSAKKERSLTLDQVEDRIYEARWNPIAVASNFERLAIEEIS